MTDTSGFYKNDNGNLLYASSAVIGAEIHIIKELKDTYEYPVSGWSWFDNAEAARLAYDLPAPPPAEAPTGPYGDIPPNFTIPTPNVGR